MASLARSIFSKMPRAGEEMGEEGMEGDGAPKMPDARAVAGKRLAKALEGGDGAAVMAALEAALEECQSKGETIEDEPMGEGGDYAGE
jgi:hypothetical protein